MYISHPLLSVFIIFLEKLLEIWITFSNVERPSKKNPSCRVRYEQFSSVFLNEKYNAGVKFREFQKIL